MNKHELFYLAEKYAVKKANAQEKLAVDIFFKKIQDQEAFPLVKLNREKRDKIFRGIEYKIQLKKISSKKYWRKIISSAAVLFLLIGSILLSLILDNNLTQVATKGEKKEIEFKDGSRIFLNSGSKINYPDNFKENQKITLEGEAFFEVAPNPGKYFPVQSGDSETKVLGTSFNINEHSEEKEKISVNSGIVEVSKVNNPSQRIEFTKNMQLSFRDGEKLKITEGSSAIALIKDLQIEYKTPKNIIIREQTERIN